MDPVPVCSVESGADTGCLASKEKEGIADPSEIVESNSTDQVLLERSRIQTDETHDNTEQNKEGKLPSEIAESNSDDEVKERSQTKRDQTHDNEVDKEGKLPSGIAESNSDDEVKERSQTERDETDDNEVNKKEKRKKGDEDCILYLPLYRAALADDWKTVRRILKDDPNALTAQITPNHDTLLHVAVSRSHSIKFVEELLNRMPPESLAIPDRFGNTALSYSAILGNTDAAKLLVEKNPDLTQMQNQFNCTPLHLAAECGHKETVCYLLDVTQGKQPGHFSKDSGVEMLYWLISSDFYDIALDLLECNPKIAVNQVCGNCTASALQTLAEKPQAFASGSQLGFWQRTIYHYIPLEMDNVTPKPTKGGDVEDPMESSQKCSAKSTQHTFLQQISTAFGTQCGNVYAMLWIIIRHLVPRVNHIHDAKLMHKKSIELVKLMSAKVILSGENVEKSFRKPLFIATQLGNHEFVKEIMKAFPYSMWFSDEDKRSIFQLAILERHEKIFNLLYQVDLDKNYFATREDKFLNNLLHSAGELKPSTHISGAALQMQRELQWFKEVEKFVQPSLKEKKNLQGKTPKMVFTENHKELVKQGEKWMKATASSCTVVAALITTVVFAAAFTVPGGNNSDQGIPVPRGNNSDQGIPIFLHESSFIVFAVSDAIALFSSSTSMLMFLGILTSRYSEEDFLKSLPMKLIIGLLTLFISIASMMIAFSATLHIVLVHRFNWVVIPIASLACLPVTLFAFLQFPLLVEIFLSTYGPSIFHRESKNLFS